MCDEINECIHGDDDFACRENCPRSYDTREDHFVKKEKEEPKRKPRKPRKPRKGAQV